MILAFFVSIAAIVLLARLFELQQRSYLDAGPAPARRSR